MLQSTSKTVSDSVTPCFDDNNLPKLKLAYIGRSMHTKNFRRYFPTEFLFSFNDDEHCLMVHVPS